MQNSIGSPVEALSKIVGGRAEALEFRVEANFAGADVPLKDLRLKKGLLIACIMRDNRLIFPSGADSIHFKDSVIVITTRTGLESLNDILA